MVKRVMAHNRHAPKAHCGARFTMSDIPSLASCISGLHMRTNTIDLRSDTSVDHRSFSALLFFIMSNTFTAGGDTNFAFAVRRLADRYRLPQLVEKIEVELVNMLSADNVLAFLGQVVGSGGLLELACLEMIKADECEILKSKHETLDQIIEDHPDLAKRIMRLLVGRTGKKRPLGGD